jgi:transposase
MRALDPEVVEVIWQAVDPLLPAEVETHRLGGHRSRVPDRLCLWGMLIRLVTGSSWVDIEAILEHRVSDTTLRARRDEWIAAGVFEQLNTEALAAFDRIARLRLPRRTQPARHHLRPQRPRHPTPTQQATRQETTRPPRAALDRRSYQHLVVQPRPTPPQHRPANPPPPRRPLPRHHHHPHHRPPHRPPHPMEPSLSTYPLKS